MNKVLGRKGAASTAQETVRESASVSEPKDDISAKPSFKTDTPAPVPAPVSESPNTDEDEDVLDYFNNLLKED